MKRCVQSKCHSITSLPWKECIWCIFAKVTVKAYQRLHSSLWSWREVGNKREILFLIRLLKVGESGTNNAKVGGKDQRASRQQKTGRFACKFCRLINKDVIPADTSIQQAIRQQRVEQCYKVGLGWRTVGANR